MLVSVDFISSHSTCKFLVLGLMDDFWSHTGHFGNYIRSIWVPHKSFILRGCHCVLDLASRSGPIFIDWFQWQFHLQRLWSAILICLKYSGLWGATTSLWRCCALKRSLILLSKRLRLFFFQITLSPSLSNSSCHTAGMTDFQIWTFSCTRQKSCFINK